MGSWHVWGGGQAQPWEVGLLDPYDSLFVNPDPRPDHLCFDRTTYDTINGPGDHLYARHNWSSRTTSVPGPNQYLVTGHIILRHRCRRIMCPGDTSA